MASSYCTLSLSSILDIIGIRTLSSRSYSLGSKHDGRSFTSTSSAAQQSYTSINPTNTPPITCDELTSNMINSLQNICSIIDPNLLHDIRLQVPNSFLFTPPLVSAATSSSITTHIRNPNISNNLSRKMLNLHPSSLSFYRNLHGRNRSSRVTKSTSQSPFNNPEYFAKIIEADKKKQLGAYVSGALMKFVDEPEPRSLRYLRWANTFFGYIPYLAFLLILGYVTYKTSVGKDSYGNEIEMTKGNTGPSPRVERTFFKDIIGCDEVKTELMEVVEYLKDPKLPGALGAKLPKGVLLMGEPGVGKTMMARAVATEAGVSFLYRHGSSFDEIFVGVGASRVKELFAKARAEAPCVIFIDEIDAVGGKRGKNNSVSRQTINQLLGEMDGFKENEGVIVIGATNLDTVLDPALTRAGRFDNKLFMHLPDAEGRLKLLQHYLSKVRISKPLDLKSLADNLTNFSGADIRNLVNQAALRAANTNSPTVNDSHLQWAKKKVQLGRERTVFDEDELKNTAYHEAAHTIVAFFLKLPIEQVTVIAHSNALGHMSHYQTEKVSTREELLARIAVALAGKMGEEACEGTGKHSMGCSSDYTSATRIAHTIVGEMGLGKILLSLYNPGTRISPLYQKKIDEEVKLMLKEAEAVAKKIMKENADKHKKLAEVLMEKKTLNFEEIKQVLS